MILLTREELLTLKFIASDAKYATNFDLASFASFPYSGARGSMSSTQRVGPGDELQPARGPEINKKFMLNYEADNAVWRVASHWDH